MGKFRTKTKTGKNRQRWKKGQSSSSNPSKTKHRDAAKAKLLRVGFGVPEVPKSFENGPARLTAESLLKHDALMGTVSTTNQEEGDALTLGQTNKTFDTFASTVWSNCSNVSFGRLLPRFNPSNPKHKEMLAILSAVSEVIKENRIDETNTDEPSGVEYFLALLTSLDSSDSVESLSAVISLLAIVIKTIEKEILQAKFSDSSKLLLETLSRHVNSEDASLVRGLLGCISVILRAQTKETWGYQSTIRVMESILPFVIDGRPKVRKAAQHAICGILARFVETRENSPRKNQPVGLFARDSTNLCSGSKEDDAMADFHPAAGKTSEFLIKTIEDNVGKNEKAVLHVLILLKEILHNFPKQHVKRSCDTIVSIMTRQDRLALSCGFQALYGLLAARPSAKSLPAELNARLITAMYDFQPAMDDNQPSTAWLAVMQEAHINLSQQDPHLCLENLPKLFTKATRYWVHGGEAASAATTAMKAVLNEALGPHIGDIDKDASSVHVRDLFQSIENGLKFEFHESWAQVLNLLTTFFAVCGDKYSGIVGRCLKSLAELRSSANFTFTNELDYVIGKAVRTMGPEVVLSHVPLQITGKEENFDFPRSWLLPVLRENIQKAKLAFFKTYFLPIAQACDQRSKTEEDKIGKKTYEMLFDQIWALLPGFCNNPTDFNVAFDQVVADMGRNLINRKDLRMYIMASLRQLLLKCCTASSEVNSTVVESNVAVMSKYAEKFLKNLLDAYLLKPTGAEEAGQRMSMMETIKLFLPLVNNKNLGNIFDIVLSKYNGTTDDFLKDTCHDLLRVMLCYQDQVRIKAMYEMCVSALTNKDHKKQKKAYKMLEEICASDIGSSCHEFLKSHLSQIQEQMLASLSKASPPSQVSRLRCLTNIIKNLDDDQEEFVYKVIPEAILCVKAVNEKARSGSFTLLVVIGEALQRWKSDQTVEDVLKDYMKVILAGLAGGPTMIHCTLKAITRVYYEFRDIFPEELTEMLIDNICLLVTSQSREVVNPSISFLHVFIQVQPVMESAKFCEKIVNSLCKMTEDCKRHFRLKTRYLLDRLVRKFDYDVVKSLIPKEDETTHKRLKNIRKIQARKKKNDEQNNEDNSDADENDEFRIKSKPKSIDEILAESEMPDNDDDEDMDTDSNKKRVQVRRKKKSATYIAEENNGEAIVDFLDPSASQKVRSSLANPNAGSMTKQKKKDEFEMTSDGKFIIRDSDEEDEEAFKQPKGYELDDSDGENDQETFAAMVSTAARKRKRTGTSVASSKASQPAMKYQAGGTGIHRPLHVNSKKDVKEYGSEYRSTKAKGDVKRKGKPDPYAYVPLQKSALNRRKKAKFEGQFKSLANAANKGSIKGKKAKGLAGQMKKVKIN